MTNTSSRASGRSDDYSDSSGTLWSGTAAAVARQRLQNVTAPYVTGGSNTGTVGPSFGNELSATQLLAGLSNRRQGGSGANTSQVAVDGLQGWYMVDATDRLPTSVALTTANYNRPELASMELGVDYGQRPDRATNAVDRYVQFDAADVYRFDAWQSWSQAWQMSAGSPNYGIALEYVPWEDMTGVSQANPHWQGRRPGSEFLQVTSLSAAVVPIEPNPYRTELRWGLRVVPRRLTGPDFTAAGQAETWRPLTDTTQTFPKRGPWFTLVFPRWRVWIPEPAITPPLRQKQRDDGQGRAAKRFRGNGSRQGSNRQRGYLMVPSLSPSVST